MLHAAGDKTHLSLMALLRMQVAQRREFVVGVTAARLIGPVHSHLKMAPEKKTPAARLKGKTRVPRRSYCCANCGVTESSGWRRIDKRSADRYCNRCGLHYKTHGSHKVVRKYATGERGAAEDTERIRRDMAAAKALVALSRRAAPALVKVPAVDYSEKARCVHLVKRPRPGVRPSSSFWPCRVVLTSLVAFLLSVS